jgi:hypothetical protein
VVSNQVRASLGIYHKTDGALDQIPLAQALAPIGRSFLADTQYALRAVWYCGLIYGYVGYNTEAGFTWDFFDNGDNSGVNYVKYEAAITPSPLPAGYNIMAPKKDTYVGIRAVCPANDRHGLRYNYDLPEAEVDADLIEIDRTSKSWRDLRARPSKTAEPMNAPTALVLKLPATPFGEPGAIDWTTHYQVGETLYIGEEERTIVKIEPLPGQIYEPGTDIPTEEPGYPVTDVIFWIDKSLESNYEADEWVTIHKNLVKIGPPTVVSYSPDWSLEDVINDLCATYQVDAQFHSVFEDPCDEWTIGPLWDQAHMTGTWGEFPTGLVATGIARSILPTLEFRPDIRVTGSVKLNSIESQMGFFFRGWNRDGTGVNFYEYIMVNSGILEFGLVQHDSLTWHRFVPLNNHLTLPLTEYFNLTLVVQGNWISVWCEGNLLGTFWDNNNINSSGLVYGTWGLCGRASGVMKDIRIAELSNTRETWLADRNASLLQSIQGWIENRPLTMVPTVANGLIFSMFDDRDGPEVFYEDMTQISETVTGREIPTHVRVTGAEPWADYWDVAQWLKDGYVFAGMDIAELETEGDCYDRAVRLVRMAKENRRQLQLIANIRPWLELEDKIHVTAVAEHISGDYIISQLDLVGGEQLLQFDMTVTARLLVE